MKKIISAVLVAVLLLCLSTSVFAAGQEYTFSLLVDGQNSATVSVGDQFTVTLVLTTTDGQGFDLYSMQDYICFDQQMLRFVEGSIVTYPKTEGTGTTQILQASAIKFSSKPIEHANRIYIYRAGLSAEELPASAVLLSFRLEAVKAGTTTLSHDTIRLLDADGEQQQVQGINATVTVKPAGEDAPSEPEETTKPSEPEETTKPCEPEETTKPSEPEETTKPNETTKPSQPDTSDEPDNSGQQSPPSNDPEASDTPVKPDDQPADPDMDPPKNPTNEPVLNAPDTTDDTNEPSPAGDLWIPVILLVLLVLALLICIVLYIRRKKTEK